VDIEDLVDDFISFFIGGQDSTQSLLTFAVVLTLLHPDVLAR
jgi:cytochrome P450